MLFLHNKGAVGDNGITVRLQRTVSGSNPGRSIKGERVTSFIYSTNLSVHSVNGSTLGFQPSSLGSNPNDRM